MRLGVPDAIIVIARVIGTGAVIIMVIIIVILIKGVNDGTLEADKQVSATVRLPRKSHVLRFVSDMEQHGSRGSKFVQLLRRHSALQAAG